MHRDCTGKKGRGGVKRNPMDKLYFQLVLNHRLEKSKPRENNLILLVKLEL